MAVSTAEAMGEATSNKILERKAASGRESHLARAMTVQKALRLTIAKVAEDRHDLALATLAIAVESVTNEGLPGVLKDDQLLILLEGPGRQIGVAMLDGAFVGGLVQQQTMGQVHAEMEDERKPTRTDAALAAPLLDDLIGRLENLVERPSDQMTFKGFRYAAMSDDLRLALMALEADTYRSFEISLDIARGARQGKMTLLLPEPGQVEIVAEHTADDLIEPQEEGPDVVKTVFQLEAELNIVLCKLRLPLGQLENLQTGSVIELPPNVFPDVDVTTINGDVVGKGQLGQMDGQRAVQFDYAPKSQNMPLRRASDRGEADVPDVQLLDRRSGTGQPEPMPDFPGTMPSEPPDIPALPDVGSDLPDLPDLPDLGGTPDDNAFEPPASIASDDALPELDDLPNLADLPDLADLPELKMA